MYWFNSKPGRIAALIGGIVMITFGLGCDKPEIKETGATLKYFDIKGYFTGQINNLKKINKPIFKTVVHNSAAESKDITINNWAQELDVFTSSDINRPAWKNSYTVIDNDGQLIYRAKDPDLKMHEMVIKQDKGQVKWILIYNKTKNILYQTTEKLTYFPDSLYLIEKDQKVRLMGANHYKIEGEIKK